MSVLFLITFCYPGLLLFLFLFYARGVFVVAFLLFCFFLLVSPTPIRFVSVLCSHFFLFSFLPCGAVAFYSWRDGKDKGRLIVPHIYRYQKIFSKFCRSSNEIGFRTKYPRMCSVRAVIAPSQKKKYYSNS